MSFYLFYQPIYTRAPLPEATPSSLDSPLPFEPKDYAYLDAATVLNTIQNVPGTIELLRWEHQLRDACRWLSDDLVNLVAINRDQLSKTHWHEAADMELSKLGRSLIDIEATHPRGFLFEKLMELFESFRRALPNWSVQQANENMVPLLSFANKAVATIVVLSGYTENELSKLDTPLLKALDHPSTTFMDVETRGEVLAMQQLGAALHSLENLCKGSPSLLSDYGRARFLGETRRVLDCPLPEHPEHLEILSQGFELISITLDKMERGDNPSFFKRGHQIISAVRAVLEIELDYVTWRHHGTHNIFETRMPIEEELQLRASTYHLKAREILERSVAELKAYCAPEIVPTGAQKIFPLVADEMQTVLTFQAARNDLVIEPSQFVRIRTYSKAYPPPRELLREIEIVQHMRLSDDALLSIESEQRMRADIESGKLALVTLTRSDNKLLGFFAICPDEENLTESGKMAVEKLKNLKSLKYVKLSFLQLVVTDVTAQSHLAPWARTAYSFVSEAGQNIALDAYGPDTKVAMVLLCRDGIKAEKVYEKDGWKRTNRSVTMNVNGRDRTYNIWLKMLRDPWAYLVGSGRD